jgi:hypothetical protein
MYANSVHVVQNWKDKLEQRHKKIITKFCNLINVSIADFNYYAEQREKFLCLNKKRIEKNCEDVLTTNQKNEIASFFRQKGFILAYDDILQYKNNTEAIAEVFACRQCPLIIIRKDFWKQSIENKHPTLLHEITHITHNDTAVLETMTLLWNIHQENLNPPDQRKFKKIYHKITKFCEKRADIEALLSSTPHQRICFLRNLRPHAENEIGKYLLKNALKNNAATHVEQQLFKDCLTILNTPSERKESEWKLVRQTVEYIYQQKERFTFVKQPISWKSEDYPQEPHYPSYLERFEYCTEVIKDLESASSIHKGNKTYVGLWNNMVHATIRKSSKYD